MSGISRRLGWVRRYDPIVVFGVAALAALYVISYEYSPFLPHWFQSEDQKRYLISAAALARGDLLSAHHWYPLGYPLLGAIFSWLTPANPFYVIDLASLLVSFAACMSFARRSGVNTAMAAVLFLATACIAPIFFQQWVIPWTTTLSGAAIWLLLANTAAYLGNVRRPALSGFLIAAIAVTRPVDALLALPCVAAMIAADYPRMKEQGSALIGDWFKFVLGFAAVAGAYLALHLAIYGAHPSGYMAYSRRIGFTFYDFGWKSYVILVDPRPWFDDGVGLLRRCPWMILSLAAIASTLSGWRSRDRWPRALLATVILLHVSIYLSYVDLVPTGLWRYNNIHYWVWLMPGYALLALFLVQDISGHEKQARMRALFALAAALLISGIRVDPAPVRSADAAKAVDFVGYGLPGQDPDNAPLRVRDNLGVMRGVADMHVVRIAGGLRVIALKRDIEGAAQFVPAPRRISGPTPPPPIRYGEKIEFGWPRWLPEL